MLRRKQTERERFDTLALEYGSRTALARSLAGATGQSAKTVLRHFKEGKVTPQETQLLKRREKYTYKERPRQYAKQVAKDLASGSKTVGGKKIGKYNEEIGMFSGKNILAGDILKLNGLDSMFINDFSIALVHGELEGIDLGNDAGKNLIVTAVLFSKDRGEKKFSRVFKIDNELPANIWEFFRRIYKDGSEDAVYVI